MVLDSGTPALTAPVAISPSFAPAASTSFVVISSLLKGAIATTLQTRGISASDAKGEFNQTSFDIAVTIKTDSWLFPVPAASSTQSLAFAWHFGIPLGWFVPDRWDIERTPHLCGTLAVSAGAERSIVEMTISSAFSSVSLILNP